MKKLYTLAFALLSTFGFAQNFDVTYTFEGVTNASGTTDPTPVPTGTNITFSSFTAVNPEVTENYNSSGGGRFSFNTQAQGATNGVNDYASLTGAIDLTKYYQVVLSPADDYQLTLNQIIFKAQRSGTGIRTYAVRTSADNFGANVGSITIDPANPILSTQDGNIFFWTDDATTSGQNGSTINVSNIVDITEPLTVRFYGWNAEAAGGTFSIDDVRFVGSVEEEPTAGINDNNIAGLKLYPNPLSGNVLTITSDANATKAVAIYDVLGKQVVNTVTANGTVNVEGLNAGIYIVKITEEGKTATRKLVVK